MTNAGDKMKTLVCLSLIFLVLAGCGSTTVSTGPKAGIGPLEVGLHLDSNGKLVLDTSISVPLIGDKDLGAGLNWETTFSTVLNQVSDKQNHLVILWQDDSGNIREQEYSLGQAFTVNFEHDQWVRKIEHVAGGNVVVFVEKQEMEGENTRTSSPVPETAKGNSLTEVTNSFYDAPDDGEVLNRFCTSDWETCRSVTIANANWQGLTVASIGGGYHSDGYLIERTFLFYDTSSIPNNAVIQSAILRFYTGQWLNGSTTVHVVRSTADAPLSVNSFTQYINKSGGSVTPTSPFTWWSIELDDNSLNWIINGGITKLALIHDNDLNGIKPSVPNDILIATGEDTDHRPYLVISYVIPSQ
jgi:hypothetical protein